MRSGGGSDCVVSGVANVVRPSSFGNEDECVVLDDIPVVGIHIITGQLAVLDQF